MKGQRNLILALVIGLVIGFLLGRIRGEPGRAASHDELLAQINERLPQPLVAVPDTDSVNMAYFTSTGKNLEDLRKLHLGAGADAWRGTILVKRFGDATFDYYDGTELIIGNFVLKGDKELIAQIRELGSSPVPTGK